MPPDRRCGGNKKPQVKSGQAPPAATLLGWLTNPVVAGHELGRSTSASIAPMNSASVSGVVSTACWMRSSQGSSRGAMWSAPSQAKRPVSSPVVAPGAQVEKLAGGFHNISGGAAGPQGDFYFVDAHCQRIYRWLSSAPQLSTVTMFTTPPAGSSPQGCPRTAAPVGLWQSGPPDAVHSVPHVALLGSSSIPGALEA